MFSMVAEHGAFEPEIMEIMAEVLPPDGVALDVGANIGVLTLPLGRICRDGHVFAFEPGTEAAKYLRRNLSANGVENVTVEEVAVLDVTGTVTLAVNTDGSAWSYVSDDAQGPSTEEVDSVRLDDWAAERRPARIDLIKMDVESSELRALAGAARTLRQYQPVLIVEYNPLIFQLVQAKSPTLLLNALRAYGRFVYALLPTHHSVRITSQRHLDRICGNHGLINLLASPRPLSPARGHFRSTVGGLLHYVYLWRRHNRWRRPPTAWFASTAVRINGPRHMRAEAGTTTDVRVTIANDSLFWLSSNYDAVPVYCGYRWFTSDGRPVGAPISPRQLTADNVTKINSIRPGGRADVVCRARVPDQPGEYELRIGIVQTSFVWIDEADPSSGARVRFDVH